MSIFVLVAAAAAVVTAGMCASELFGMRYRRLARQRRGESIRDLQAHFRRADVHIDVLLAVQEHFERLTTVRRFPVRPSDDLLSVYGMHREDVQDAVVAIAASARCLSPRLLDDSGGTIATTVEELIYAVHHHHRVHQQSLAPDGQRRVRIL